MSFCVSKTRSSIRWDVLRFNCMFDAVYLRWHRGNSGGRTKVDSRPKLLADPSAPVEKMFTEYRQGEKKTASVSKSSIRFRQVFFLSFFFFSDREYASKMPKHQEKLQGKSNQRSNRRSLQSSNLNKKNSSSGR